MVINTFSQRKILKNSIKVLKNQKWTFINVQNPKNFQIIFFKKSEQSLIYYFGGSRTTFKKGSPNTFIRFYKIFCNDKIVYGLKFMDHNF
jgi:hypothetical protein